MDYSYSLELLPNDISLMTIQTTDNDKIITQLLKHVFFSTDPIFYSLTVGNDEISLFIDTKIAHLIKDAHPIDNYRLIRVFDENNGVSLIGIVSKISTIFAANEIPILYVNSFNNNYVLLKNADIDKAKECLREIRVKIE